MRFLRMFAAIAFEVWRQIGAVDVSSRFVRMFEAIIDIYLARDIARVADDAR